MKTLELNRIALWRPKLLDDFTIREAGAGRPVVENQIISKTKSKTYRYAKNYSRGKGKDKIKFCLFVVTYSDDAENAEKQLDKIAKKITSNKIDIETVKEVVSESTNTNFTYTDFFLKEGK